MVAAAAALLAEPMAEPRFAKLLAASAIKSGAAMRNDTKTSPVQHTMVAIPPSPDRAGVAMAAAYRNGVLKTPVCIKQVCGYPLRLIRHEFVTFDPRDPAHNHS
ncbi:hypothetical protein [Mycobacterium interjectum]|uniref:hypothetical protein n=1 Tax=Mycobacterium interjectum TaxID=33895 RepID=UPI0014300DD8|nr:hypothetical protein [Mycobacterium interjectum]MCV7092871.1 hypothetical protein [Mycobacterium interjectum]